MYEDFKLMYELNLKSLENGYATKKLNKQLRKKIIEIKYSFFILPKN